MNHKKIIRLLKSCLKNLDQPPIANDKKVSFQQFISKKNI